MEPFNIDRDTLKNILKYYHKADALANHPAREWAAVTSLLARGTSFNDAMKSIIDRSLSSLEAIHKSKVSAARNVLIGNNTYKSESLNHHVNKSTIYRWCEFVLDHLPEVIQQFNDIAAQDSLQYYSDEYTKFTNRFPVFGFDELIYKIKSLLHNPTGPSVIAIEGLGGLGKTTLAQCVREQCGNTIFKKILWATAKQMNFNDQFLEETEHIDTSPIHIDDIISQCIEQLGIIEKNLNSAEKDLAIECRNNPYLIIIDNLETVQDIRAVSDFINKIAGRSKILITTRDHDTSMLTPATIHFELDELDQPTSYMLIKNAAPITGATHLATASNADLGKIYAVTGGNPLALWLVAGQARDIPLDEFLRVLGEEYQQDRRGRALYTYLYRRSWDMLSDDAKNVLFTMHRFNVGVSYTLLWGSTKIDKGVFNRAIHELRSRMLLKFDGSLYSIHQLTYSFLRVVLAGWWE